MKKILNIIKKTINILTNLTIIFFVIIWIYYTYQLNIKKVEEEKIFDYSLFIVTTGSMQNAININDIIVVKKTQNIEKGDIIAFEEDESLIVHRIIKKTQEEIITKGDANNQEDEPIMYEQIIGKVIYIIPLDIIILIFL